MSEAFKLIETMRFDRGVAHLDSHMVRLKKSADHFGIPIDTAAVRSTVLDKCAAFLTVDHAQKVRLTVDEHGHARTTVVPIPSIAPSPRRVAISESVIDESDSFRRHKTTKRELYDLEYRQGLEDGLFEIIYMNRAGRLAEGSRTNIFVETGGMWLTPPVEDGALPGVFRSMILGTNNLAKEQCVTAEMLHAADRVFVCNAVVGVVEVELIDFTR
ncbi:MAG: hypothetical protein HKN37_02050 [Rhodothermales bacterium]|nr:hypothetical protein [Rhodothermales bacterium]